MSKTTTPQAATKGEASRKFVQAVKHILSIPKEELAKREATYQQERAAKRGSRKAKQTLVILAGLFFLVGCATGTHYVASSRYPAKSVESVTVLYQEPNRPYDVLAFVQGRSITILDSPELIRRRALEQAAAAGADAVIFTTSGQGRRGSPRAAEGRAIKWK